MTHSPDRPAVPVRTRGLTRGSLLAGLGASGAGLTLAACGGGSDGSAGGTATTDATPGPQDGDAAVQASLDAAGVDAPVTLTVRRELRADDGSRSATAVRPPRGGPRAGARRRCPRPPGPRRRRDRRDGRAGADLPWRGSRRPRRRRDRDRPRAARHLRPRGRDGRGLGGRHRGAPRHHARAVRGRNIGDEFPSLETPTVEDPKELEELCTRDPDCGMHDVPLDTALAEGAPTVLVISTPNYCATRICGPVVDVVLQVKEETERDDVRFIHVEVFEDAGNTPTDVVTELQLPTEPWTSVVAGLLLAGCADGAAGPTPEESPTSGVTPTAVAGATDACGPAVEPPLQDGSHLIGDAEPPVPYSSTPATSGWHASGEPRTGVIPADDPLTDPEVVLTIEVGQVAAYDPDWTRTPSASSRASPPTPTPTS